MASAVASFTTSYLNRSPYITLEQFKNAPTALDVSNLVANGTQAQQDQELANQIARASSWMDSYVAGVEGTICATLNTEVTRIRPDRRGFLHISCSWRPVLEVKTLQIASTPNLWTQVDLTNTIVENAGFIVSAGFGLNSSQGPLSLGSGIPGQQLWAQCSYINGWANTTLSASVLAGATSITAVSPVGLYAGMPIQIPDGSSSETVVVAASYAVDGGNVIPLASPTVYAHAAGVGVTVLPPSIQQAAILLTSALIKTRGDSAIVLHDISSKVGHVEGFGTGMEEDVAIAMELLEPLRGFYV